MKTIQRSEPTAHVTVNRNRQKNYGDKIYFKNNTQFEIELHNPLTKRVLVKIEIDGRTISSTGLILNPGQRVYLERWIEDSNKFLFNTYEVEDTQESKDAVQDNGRVKVSFFTEQDVDFTTNTVPSNIWNGWNSYPYNPLIITTPSPYSNPIIYCSGSFGGTTTSDTYSVSNGNVGLGDQNPSGIMGVNSSYTSNVNYSDASISNANISMDMFSSAESEVKGSLETGRTEMGEKSSQSFGESFGNFNNWATKTWEWQILPESLKPVELSQLREYCPNCRNRIRKQTWKFCPGCGEAL